MKYQVLGVPPQEIANVEAALKIMDHAAEITDQDPDLRLEAFISDDFQVKVRLFGLSGAEEIWEFKDQEIEDPRYNNNDRRQRRKELIRLGVIAVAGAYLGRRPPPWGILSGVRPTKIFHYLRDHGFSLAEIRDKLTALYGLAPKKAGRLIEIGRLQEKYLRARTDCPLPAKGAPRLISLYAGIPFCPSRCRYCSFAAVSLESHGHLVKDFIRSFEEEIRVMGALCRELNLAVETVYVGGGTPTSLDDESFGRILKLLTGNFCSAATVEYTVEAGRPETISPAKLGIMSECGVTRISVNPQSMNQKTLERIGRGHTIADVYNAVDLVRRFPTLRLNMDLILGLPGEAGADFNQSLAQVLQFSPENITIHTLAPKRAASWRKSFNNLELPDETGLAATLERAVDCLQTLNYDPYYLYRQRFILADQENIGFTKPGQECVYNIQMMEERQSILGLGGGAVTKWVAGSDYRVYREQNPKCPATYSHRLSGLLVKKVQQSRLLLG
ncbi:MAG: coproporphyrinogen dehydrogenase HemZ [Firmicutes bacterium]|nr:coproporphyrinogen dehydrogenase HemZ [Bacillota bacterium]